MGDDISAGSSSPDPSLHAPEERRQACQWCAQRKKACNGNGTSPCQLCLSKGLECVYAIKKRRGPAKGTKYRRRKPKLEDVVRRRPRSPSKDDTSSEDYDSNSHDSPSGSSDSAIVPSRKQQQHQQVARPFMGASVATGLVGMVENRLLAAALENLGVLVQVSDEEGIRKALVSMIVSSAPPPPSSSSSSSSNGGALVGSNAFDTAQRESAALAALLWSTICLGAIIEGSGSYVAYLRSTHEALRMARCLVVPEVCRAYLILATAHCMLGDMPRFARYVTTAQKVYRALPGELQSGSLRASVAVYAHLLSDPMADPMKYEEQLMAYSLPLSGSRVRRLTQFQLVQVFTGAETLYTKAWLLQQRLESAGAVTERFTGPLYDTFVLNSEVLRILEMAVDTVDCSTYPSSAMSVTGTCAWLAFRHALAGDVAAGTRFAVEAADALVSAPNTLLWEPWWHYAHVLCFVLASGAGLAAYQRLKDAHNAVTKDSAYLLPDAPSELEPTSCCSLAICQDVCRRIRFNVIANSALLRHSTAADQTSAAMVPPDTLSAIPAGDSGSREVCADER